MITSLYFHAELDKLAENSLGKTQNRSLKRIPKEWGGSFIFSSRSEGEEKHRDLYSFVNQHLKDHSQSFRVRIYYQQEGVKRHLPLKQYLSQFSDQNTVRDELVVRNEEVNRHTLGGILANQWGKILFAYVIFVSIFLRYFI